MPTIAAQWNRRMDCVIDAVDTCQADDRVVRRSCLDAALRNHGYVLQTREAFVTLLDRCRFFELGAVRGWLDKVFPDQTGDPEERAIRFTEEALELAQTDGVTREQMHALVDQVFDKPVGEKEQELGGVMVTLAAYCAVSNLDAGKAFSEEFARVNSPEMIVKIQRKHAQKLVISSKLR